MNARCGVWPTAAAATQRSSGDLLQHCCFSTGSFLEARRHAVGVSYLHISHSLSNCKDDVFLSHSSSEHRSYVSVCELRLTTLLTTQGSQTFAVLSVFY